MLFILFSDLPVSLALGLKNNVVHYLPGKINWNYYCYYYYNHFMALWILSGTTRVSRYQKGKSKTNLDLLEQETVSGSGISWAICKSAPHPDI